MTFKFSSNGKILRQRKKAEFIFQNKTFVCFSSYIKKRFC